MKRLHLDPWTLAALAVALFAVAALAAPQVFVPRKVVAGGGGVIGQQKHAIVGTVGQPSVATAIREGHVLASGYWHPDDPASPVPPGEETPRRPALLGNHPNPFNPMTEIRFTVGATAAHARLRVYDMRGRLVRTLLDEVVAPGVATAVWRGRDDRGENVASGLYFFNLVVGDEVFTRKMTLLK